LGVAFIIIIVVVEVGVVVLRRNWEVFEYLFLEID
jgi:hypothetical protein